MATNHLITLSLIGNLIHADPNPLVIQPPINPGDTVTWFFDDTVIGSDLKVEFKGLRDLTPPGPPLPVDPQRGPFESLSPLVQRRIVGAFRQDLIEKERITRFFYKVIKDGNTLEWDNPVQLGDATNGGGIDIPGKPPGI